MVEAHPTAIDHADISVQKDVGFLYDMAALNKCQTSMNLLKIPDGSIVL